jgi:hypothetical protein
MATGSREFITAPDRIGAIGRVDPIGGCRYNAWLVIVLNGEVGMDFHELKVKTVTELREVAKGVEGLTGYTQMNKDHLLEAICNQLNIPMHEHHEVIGIDKNAVKAEIKALKVKRQAALEAKNSAELKTARREIHKLKRRLRKAFV